MKFYKHNVQKNILQLNIILGKKTVIYTNNFFTIFYKNGVPNNKNNAAIVFKNRKVFYLEGMRIGTNIDFDKLSWRNFLSRVTLSFL